jgi:hypothetical protein
MKKRAKKRHNDPISGRAAGALASATVQSQLGIR